MAPAAAREILELNLERPAPLYLTNIVAGGGGARCSTLNDVPSQGVARGRPTSGVASRVRVPSSLLRRHGDRAPAMSKATRMVKAGGAAIDSSRASENLRRRTRYLGWSPPGADSAVAMCVTVLIPTFANQSGAVCRPADRRAKSTRPQLHYWKHSSVGEAKSNVPIN